MIRIFVLAAVVVGAGLLAGCASTSSTKVASSAGGQRVWAQNCARCHNSRSPNDYSAARWDIAMMHMRIRANLTAEEHEKIRQFLVSGE